MPNYSNIKVERKDDVFYITLNRPPVNVLNIEMMGEINFALDAALDDAALKLLVVNAEGKAFSAGVEVGDHAPGKVNEMMEQFDGMFRRLNRLAVPSLALVRGACLGGGCELALFCDIIYASEKSKFGQPEIKVGFFPPIAAFLIPRLAGRHIAMELLTSGNAVDGKTAMQLGLINRAIEDEKFNEESAKLVASICENSALIIRDIKRAIEEAFTGRFDDVLPKMDALFLNELMKTRDCAEGLNSFLEKRKPNWQNR
jgi:cyclohexa-1,5-dienecarbonyl-CoA hydratase